MKCFLKVKVTPSAGRQEVTGWEGETLKIKLKEPADKGKANAALIAYLSELLKIPKSHITIAFGHNSRNKLISIEGISEVRKLFPSKEV